MTGRPRVGFLGVYHETNTFSSLRTGIDAFQARWYVGDELLGAFAGTRTMGGGFIDGAADAGLDLVPVFGTYATPSGPVEPSAFEAVRSEVAVQLAHAGGLDGVLFELHGDLVVEGVADAEEELVAIVRDLLPGRPVATALDLHANLAAPRLRDVEVLLGYRTNPHVDTYDRGRDAARLLARVLGGAPVPYRAHRGLPVVAPPAAQRTDAEPLRSLLALADRLRDDLGLLDVTVHAGYAYGDTESTGMGFSASADPDRAGAAEEAVERLVDAARSSVALFRAEYPDAATAIERALQLGAPAVVADTGDNINGGAPGDTTWLAHEARRHPDRRFLATIADARTLDRAREAGEGGRLAVRLGGAASAASGHPVEGEAEVIRLSDGVFHNVGPMAHGARTEMGGAAWLRIGGLDVVVQGVPRQPNDPGMFTSLGIDPARYDVLLLKGAAALRAAWQPIASGFVDAGTPGETDSVLERLDYRRARVSTTLAEP